MALTKITNSGITDGAVTAAKIGSSAVTTAKINASAVTTAKINADAVTDAKIADDVVGTEHLTAGEVDTTALGADAVTAAKIADDAISEEHLDVTAITGHPEKTSLVDADKFIISDSAASNALKYVQKSNMPSGIYNLIASTNLSSEGTSFAMDNVFSDTYDKYLVFGERFRTGTNQSRIDLVLRTGGSSGSDAGNNLGGAYLGYRHSSNYVSGSVANGGAATIINNAYNDTHFHFMFNVFYPTTTGVTTAFQGQSTFREGSTSYSAFVNFGYVSLSTEDHTGFRIISSNGNFNSTDCRLTVYGITDGA